LKLCLHVVELALCERRSSRWWRASARAREPLAVLHRKAAGDLDGLGVLNLPGEPARRSASDNRWRSSVIS